MVDKTHEGICDLKGKYSGNCQNISNPDREITTGIKYRRRIYSTSTRAGEGAIFWYLSRKGKIAGDIHETKSSGISTSWCPRALPERDQLRSPSPARVDVLYTPMVLYSRNHITFGTLLCLNLHNYSVKITNPLSSSASACFDKR